MEKQKFDLPKIVSTVYRLWHSGKVGQSTIEAARRIRAHQGNHECEVSCKGEIDLIQHYKSCQKNPGHRQFIPVHDFKKEHLPPGYQDDDILDYIRAEADKTCRISVDYTSERRPTDHPGRPDTLYPFSQDRGGDWMRTGTGFLLSVQKFINDNNFCECHECKTGIHGRQTVWGSIEILTAMHVIYDDDEARHTTCHFGYDTITTILSRDCLKLTGFRVKISDVIQDWCVMTYVTHDMDIVNALQKMERHCIKLWAKVFAKYGPNINTSLSVPRMWPLTDPKTGYVVIISHPHGLSKHITVGMWTHRHTWSEIHTNRAYPGMEVDIVETGYTYNSHTCPGSSGGPVFRLWEKGMWRWITHHPHSEAGEDNTNNNKSAVWTEHVSGLRPTTTSN